MRDAIILGVFVGSFLLMGFSAWRIIQIADGTWPKWTPTLRPPREHTRPGEDGEVADR